MADAQVPSPQPTSSPSGLWVAPSIPVEITSDLTIQPTNNAGLKFPLSIEPKKLLEKDDADAMIFEIFLFIGIVILVIALVAIYFHRRSVANKANAAVSTERGKYELVNVQEVDEDAK